MKIMMFNKAFNLHANHFDPCNKCVVSSKMCSRIPVEFCKYGGFQLSDTKIFTL